MLTPRGGVGGKSSATVVSSSWLWTHRRLPTRAPTPTPPTRPLGGSRRCRPRPGSAKSWSRASRKNARARSVRSTAFPSPTKPGRRFARLRDSWACRSINGMPDNLQAEHRDAARIATEAGRALLHLRQELAAGTVDQTAARERGDRSSHDLLLRLLAEAYRSDPVL